MQMGVVTCGKAEGLTPWGFVSLDEVWDLVENIFQSSKKEPYQLLHGFCYIVMRNSSKTYN